LIEKQKNNSNGKGFWIYKVMNIFFNGPLQWFLSVLIFFYWKFSNSTEKWINSK
jgi:hypothetical protein